MSQTCHFTKIKSLNRHVKISKSAGCDVCTVPESRNLQQRPLERLNVTPASRKVHQILWHNATYHCFSPVKTTRAREFAAGNTIYFSRHRHLHFWAALMDLSGLKAGVAVQDIRWFMVDIEVTKNKLDSLLLLTKHFHHRYRPVGDKLKNKNNTVC